MKTKNGYTGNKNAAKPNEEKATRRLSVRCLPQHKSSWEKAAESEKIDLAKWVTKTLNAAAR